MDFTPNRRGVTSLNVSFVSEEGSSGTNLNGVNKALNGTLNDNIIQEVSTQNRFSLSNNTLSDKIHFFTGTAERVLAWNRVFKQRCYFEVIASVVSLQDPQDDRQIILLKDKKGPILQVVHYLDQEIEEQEFSEGQMLRCVGYMTGINTLTAVNIRKATTDEIATLKRHCYIGDFTISGLLSAEENH